MSIHAKDSRLLRASCDDVYRALLDFSAYPTWWPASMPLRVLQVEPAGVGARAAVRATGGEFTCQVVSAIPESEITLRYHGLYEGTGTWTLKPEGDGTYVQYKLDVKVRGRLARLLSRVVSFRRRHAALMQDIFTALDRHLARTRRRDELLEV